jgi:ribosome-associated protein
VSAPSRPRPPLEITADLAIPAEELQFVASRSGGPGGQNVNKVATRVSVRFDVGSSPSLSEPQRALLRERLGPRISKEGVLQVTAQSERTQRANREAAQERFAALLRRALAPRAVRRPTRTPKAAHRRRLLAKRAQSRRKKERQVSAGEE